jgi:hypothetical protein
LYLKLKNGSTFCIDDETTTLLCDEGCRRRLRVVLGVRVVVEVVESLLIVCFLLRDGDFVLLIDGLPAQVVARLLGERGRGNVMITISDGGRPRARGRGGVRCRRPGGILGPIVERLTWSRKGEREAVWKKIKGWGDGLVVWRMERGIPVVGGWVVGLGVVGEVPGQVVPQQRPGL